MVSRSPFSPFVLASSTVSSISYIIRDHSQLLNPSKEEFDHPWWNLFINSTSLSWQSKSHSSNVSLKQQHLKHKHSKHSHQFLNQSNTIWSSSGLSSTHNNQTWPTFNQLTKRDGTDWLRNSLRKLNGQRQKLSLLSLITVHSLNSSLSSLSPSHWCMEARECRWGILDVVQRTLLSTRYRSTPTWFGGSYRFLRELLLLVQLDPQLSWTCPSLPPYRLVVQHVSFARSISRVPWASTNWRLTTYSIDEFVYQYTSFALWRNKVTGKTEEEKAILAESGQASSLSSLLPFFVSLISIQLFRFGLATRFSTFFTLSFKSQRFKINFKLLKRERMSSEFRSEGESIIGMSLIVKRNSYPQIRCWRIRFHSPLPSPRLLLNPRSRSRSRPPRRLHSRPLDARRNRLEQEGALHPSHLGPRRRLLLRRIRLPHVGTLPGRDPSLLSHPLLRPPTQTFPTRIPIRSNQQNGRSNVRFTRNLSIVVPYESRRRNFCGDEREVWRTIQQDGSRWSWIFTFIPRNVFTWFPSIHFPKPSPLRNWIGRDSRKFLEIEGSISTPTRTLLDSSRTSTLDCDSTIFPPTVHYPRYWQTCQIPRGRSGGESVGNVDDCQRCREKVDLGERKSPRGRSSWSFRRQLWNRWGTSLVFSSFLSLVH